MEVGDKNSAFLLQCVQNVKDQNAEKDLEIETLSGLLEAEKRNSAELSAKTESLRRELGSLKRNRDGIFAEIRAKIDSVAEMSSLCVKIRDLESDLEKVKLEAEKRNEDRNLGRIFIREETEEKCRISAEKLERKFSEEISGFEAKIAEFERKLRMSEKLRLEAENEAQKYHQNVQEDLAKIGLERDKLVLRLKNAQNVLQNSRSTPIKHSNHQQPKSNAPKKEPKNESAPKTQKPKMRKKVTFLTDDISDDEKNRSKVSMEDLFKIPSIMSKRPQQQEKTPKMGPEMKKRKKLFNMSGNNEDFL